MNFSILLPIYIKDEPKYFKECIDSIYCQTLSPTEIVIIKDGPVQDEINSIINSYKTRNEIDIVEFQFPSNQGTGIAFAKGVELCSYEYIARMDADDICLPTRFELQLDTLRINQNIDICGGWLEEFSSATGAVLGYKKVPESDNDIKEYAKKRNPLNHPTVIFKKSKVLEAGNYRPIKFYEDYHLWIRMFLNNNKAYNLQLPLVRFRITPDFYNRRGGIQNLKYEMIAFYDIYKMGYISILQFILNISMRAVARILPIRKLIYQNILRK